VLADTHTLQRSEALRNPQEAGFTALGLRGESSLVTITYLLTRRPQMSGWAALLPAFHWGYASSRLLKVISKSVPVGYGRDVSVR
jgi:hypothetical protein